MRKQYLVFIFLFLTNFVFTKTLNLSFVGDILLSYKMENYLLEYGMTYPFIEVAPILQQADIANGNLECPISDFGAPVQNKSFYFKAMPQTIESLEYAGFDIMNLANNHIFDFGVSAFFQTVELLTNHNIAFVGAGENFRSAIEMKIINVKKMKIGFLAFSYVSPDFFYTKGNSPGMIRALKENVKSAIEYNQDKVDILVVIFHWGEEYSEKIKPYQQNLAHVSINAGADIVVGHHPHIVQPIELYKNKLIFYSLGNFVFGTYGFPPRKTADKSFIVNIKIEKGKITQSELIPLNIFNYEVLFQPKIAHKEKATKILNYIQNLSAPYGVKIGINNDRGYIQLK